MFTLSNEIVGDYSLGSFNDGDGSENVNFNMNSRFFKLCRVYSNSLKEKEKFVIACLRPS